LGRNAFLTWSKHLAVGPTGTEEGDRFVSFMTLVPLSSYAREQMIDAFWWASAMCMGLRVEKGWKWARKRSLCIR